jgi:hypothetical protein
MVLIYAGSIYSITLKVKGYSAFFLVNAELFQSHMSFMTYAKGDRDGFRKGDECVMVEGCSLKYMKISPLAGPPRASPPKEGQSDIL